MSTQQRTPIAKHFAPRSPRAWPAWAAWAALSLSLAAAPAAWGQAGGEMPQEMTIDLLQEQAYRKGVLEQGQLLRRAMKQLEDQHPAEAAAMLGRTAKRMRKLTSTAVSGEDARDLRLAANDVQWLAGEIAGDRLPPSEAVLSNVALAAWTLARHHRLAAADALSERAFKRAGYNLEAAALNTGAALAFAGQRTGEAREALDEAIAVATRLATGGRGRKLRDRFGTASSGLAIATARARSEPVWAWRRSTGRVVDTVPAEDQVVVETEDGSGPRFTLPSGALVVGRDGAVALDALISGEEVAVWYRAPAPRIAERIVRGR